MASFPLKNSLHRSKTTAPSHALKARSFDLFKQPISCSQNSLFRSSQTTTSHVPKTWTDLCSNSNLWYFQHAYWSLSKWPPLIPSIFHSMIPLPDFVRHDKKNRSHNRQMIKNALLLNPVMRKYIYRSISSLLLFFSFSWKFLFPKKKKLFYSSVSSPHNCPHSFSWASSLEPPNMLFLHVRNRLLKPSWSLPISVPLGPVEYAFSMQLRISLHFEHNSLFRPCTHFIFLFSFTKTNFGNFPSFKGLGILSKVNSNPFPHAQ